MERSAGILLPVFSLPGAYGIGCLGREARGFADFLRDNGKTFARRACPRSFDSGIQRKDVCLERDILDRLDDLMDLVGRLLNLSHSVRHLTHMQIAVHHVVSYTVCKTACGFGIFRGF